jgi:hypothetical protein
MSAPRPSPIVCDVGALPPDLASVGALARLQLGARRLALELELVNVSQELRELLELTGLAGVLGLEAGRQPEEREERLGVEEKGELDDPAL